MERTLLVFMVLVSLVLRINQYHERKRKSYLFYVIHFDHSYLKSLKYLSTTFIKKKKKKKKTVRRDKFSF